MLATPLYQPNNTHNLPINIHLRLMQPADDAVFRRLYAEVRAPEMRMTQWPQTEIEAFCDSQYSAQDHHYREYYADLEQWAICRIGEVIGRLYLATFDGVLILMDITIARAWRGQGIGTSILTDLVRQADLGLREMQLHVEPDNPARRLYQRLGFAELPDQSNTDIYLEMRRIASTAT
jgi:RimJ/RimL family protein N-acetyltransferase